MSALRQASDCSAGVATPAPRPARPWALRGLALFGLLLATLAVGATTALRPAAAG